MEANGGWIAGCFRRDWQRRAAMDHMVLNFAGIATTIVFSIALAVYLDWLALRGLMRVMPGRRTRATGGSSTVGANVEPKYQPGSKAA